jgi:competence protein ComEC
MNEPRTVYEQGEQTIYGVIQTVPNIDGDSLSMRIKSGEKEVIQVHAYLYDHDDYQKGKAYSPGDSCQIKGTLSLPLPPTNFGQFHYQGYLRSQSINWIMRPEREGIQCVRTSGNGYHQLQDWRQQQLHRIEKQVGIEYQGLMNALLFGDRTYIEEGLIEAYQRLGVIHLLAVSGLHVGMLVSLFFYLLIRLGLTKERTIEILLGMLPIYVIIAGAAPSVIRAAIMAMVVLGCIRFKRRLSPLTGIICVYLGYLFFQPFVLFHLGFQLSFLVSFGLIVSSPLIRRRYTNPIIQLLAVTFVSQLLSSPLLLIHTFEITWLSLPINMIYIPFITMIVLPLTLLSFILSFYIPSSLNFPLIFLEVVFPYIHDLMQKGANKNFASLVVGKPSSLIVLAYYGGILFASVLWEKGERFWWKWPTGILCLLFISQLVAPYVDSRAKVTMIDVGQGDSFLIELPFRKEIYLIDTGGTISFSNEEWRKRKRPFEVGGDVVVPTLKERGIRKIDRLILTHGHLDHMGGAFALLQILPIKKVYYGKGPVEGEIEHQLLTQLDQQGTKVEFIGEGFAWARAGATFQVLSPLGTETSLNNRSIVLYAEIEGVAFLFSGDLEEEGERRLITRYPNLQIDVLKAGHHGSRTSTTDVFLSHLDPKVILISAGRRNRFGHPHKEVTDRLEARGLLTFRTDLDGAIEFTIKHQNIKVRRAMEQ